MKGMSAFGIAKYFPWLNLSPQQKSPLYAARAMSGRIESRKKEPPRHGE